MRQQFLAFFKAGATAAFVVLAACGSSNAPGDGALTAGEARALAKEAYIVAYAPVANYARQSPRAFDKSSISYQGPNKLFSLPLLFNYYTANAAGVPSPNQDTLYSAGVLDLRQQPVVVSAGAVSDADRYYSLQLLDQNTDVLPYISTLTNANAGGHYLVLGPDNSAPTDTSGFTGVIHSGSQLVTILGRVEVYNAADQLNAALVQQGFKIQTLSDYSGGSAPSGSVPELLAYDADSAQGLGFLQYANIAFGLQPPEDSDPALARRLARIHVGAGQTFTASDFTQEIQDAITRGLADGAAAVQSASLSSAIVRNGWSSVDPSVLSDSGSFGTGYLARAAVAYGLLYMNTRSEAWYALASVDAKNATLDGGARYTLHFAANALPPARFFWSVTAYDASTHLFFNNLLGRYKRGSNDSLQYNDDGSLDITIQADAPTDAKAFVNWLPVGQSPFYLIIRSYGPGDGIIDGSWVPPAVEPLS
ncbi:DUF1254 domain-containing protein [Solimonas soli]|uniref:DUF1254 domain-containing protein n=1 Tax=Solimonas soli TaxID=413479 RepID=UPI0004B9FB45|nr:DUF1214 domain-containing protein [Solimonas soli]